MTRALKLHDYMIMYMYMYMQFIDQISLKSAQTFYFLHVKEHALDYVSEM